MANVFTSEDLNRFAIAGGWVKASDGLWLNPIDDENDPLPEFETHLWATLAVLERFCRQRKPGSCYWSLSRVTFSEAPEKDHYACVLAPKDGDISPCRKVGNTKQEAIIRAVLSALSEQVHVED